MKVLNTAGKKNQAETAMDRKKPLEPISEGLHSESSSMSSSQDSDIKKKNLVNRGVELIKLQKTPEIEGKKINQKPSKARKKGTTPFARLM
jgi:hypothetical protein